MKTSNGHKIWSEEDIAYLKELGRNLETQKLEIKNKKLELENQENESKIKKMEIKSQRHSFPISEGFMKVSCRCGYWTQEKIEDVSYFKSLKFMWICPHCSKQYEY